MAKLRASKGLLLPPRAVPNESEARREAWLANATATFASPSATNRQYYSVILKALWPPGHGIPGPMLTEGEIRAAIDKYRSDSGGNPYKDVFRRMRELQGEEGFISIIKEGTRYQLQTLEISQKREPRAKLAHRDWRTLKAAHNHSCASCGGQEPDVKLSPDHKVPRARSGSNDAGNWQPLCEQCNNVKSNTCRGCNLNCAVCSWAFPAEYKQLIIADDNRELIRRAAERAKTSQSDFVNIILRKHFNDSNR